jgi:hypothetical protein
MSGEPFSIKPRPHSANTTKEPHMPISQDDMSELKRLAANTYEQEKSEQIYRIIREITRMEQKIASLTKENEKLKAN